MVGATGIEPVTPYTKLAPACPSSRSPAHAQLRRINLDGSGPEVVTRGIRQVVGMDWHPYELAYASERETKFDRALRRARKLRLRLGGDPTDDEYPDKPPRMRWATYNRLLDKLRAAEASPMND